MRSLLPLLALLAVAPKGLQKLPKGAEATPAPTKEPAPGTLTRNTVPGGWLLDVAGDPEHLAIGIAGFTWSSGRALLLTHATSDDYSKQVAGSATLLGGDGKTLRVVSLSGFRPMGADLSPDGKTAVVLAEPWDVAASQKDDSEPTGTLFAFDDSGKKLWKKDVPIDRDLVLGNGWVGLYQPPPMPSLYEDDDENPPPAQIASPATFYRMDGSSLRPPQPIGGALAKAGDGLASVAEGKLSLYGSDLHRRAQVDVGFKVGIPVASADGSLIAVADFTDESDPTGAKPAPQRDLVLVDKSGKKTGTVMMRAGLGIDAALSPDGSAVLATSATLEAGPNLSLDDSKEMTLLLADRTGKVRWRYAVDRAAPTQHFAVLSVANGGKRACAGIVSSAPMAPEGAKLDEDVEPPPPDAIVCFDEAGKVIYRTEGDFDDVWLDASGEWLYTVEPGAYSKLKLDDVIKGTAFPEPKDEPPNPDTSDD